MSEPRAKRDRLKRVVRRLLDCGQGWVYVARSSRRVPYARDRRSYLEFWKPHPGGPPSPAVRVYRDGSMRGDRADVYEAQYDMTRGRMLECMACYPMLCHCTTNIAVSGGLPATGKTYTGRAGSVKEEA